MFKKTNIILILAVGILIYCIIGPTSLSYKEGINSIDCNNIHTTIDINNDGRVTPNEINNARNKLSPARNPSNKTTPIQPTVLKDYVLNTDNIQIPVPLEVFPTQPGYPNCKFYDGEIWAFCGGKPLHRYGLGATTTKVPLSWAEKKGMNYPFNDMAGNPPMGSTLEQCQQACASDPNCKGIVYGNHYNTPGNQCFKKSDMSRGAPGSGLNSYIKQGGTTVADPYKGPVNISKNKGNCNYVARSEKRWGRCP